MKRYGGKADSLMKLKVNKISVPDFFIIDENVYLEYLNYNGIKEKIERLYENNEYEKIKKIILNGKFSPSLLSKLKKEFNNLHSKTVSVRSSATNEDGKNKSFAGQYNTYLNVKDNELEISIKKCWCSLYEKNIVEYEKRHNIFGMNVIIQKMISADYSGVAFSVDPTDDKNNYTVIEIVEGLGEELVSGKKTPNKILVRRQTLTIDLKMGNLNVKEKIIKELEKIILNIEQIYKLPVDIEFAIKNQEIFILQARPITAVTKSIKPFSLSITRPHSIIEQEIYFQGEYEGIKNLTHGLYYFKPLFIFNPSHETVEIYYNYLDLEEDPNLIYRELDTYYDEFLIKYNNAIVDIERIKEIINNKTIDIKEIMEIKELLVNIYPFSSLGQLAGHFDNISERVKDKLLTYRNHFDSFIHEVCLILENIVKKKLEGDYKEYSSYITLEEISSNKIPPIKNLQKRKRGYIYYEKLHILEDYNSWLHKNNINIIVEKENSDLKGQVAYYGSAKGRVCKIFSEKDFEKFNSGDILVTPMTIPKFIDIMKKASAIITDEGGVTCHASIIARELKIPCIVGCKVATKLLNDGDMVEIDGSTGKIKIN